MVIGTTTKQEEYMNIFTFLFLNYHNNFGVSDINSVKAGSLGEY